MLLGFNSHLKIAPKKYHLFQNGIDAFIIYITLKVLWIVCLSCPNGCEKIKPPANAAFFFCVFSQASSSCQRRTIRPRWKWRPAIFSDNSQSQSRVQSWQRLWRWKCKWGDWMNMSMVVILRMKIVGREGVGGNAFFKISCEISSHFCTVWRIRPVHFDSYKIC